MIDHYKTTQKMRLKDFGFAITKMQPEIVTINDNLSVYAYFRTDVLSVSSIVDHYVPAILIALENATGVVYPHRTINLVGVPSTFDNVNDVKTALVIAR